MLSIRLGRGSVGVGVLVELEAAGEVHVREVVVVSCQVFVCIKINV